MSCSVSIIICTFNRAHELEGTLQEMRRLSVPVGFTVEILVVDNGSTDRTREVVEGLAIDNVLLRYVSEPRRGKGYAYNTGIQQARGEILLFTDDDVRVPPDWIEGMSRPILEGRMDVGTGEVLIAPDNLREWMTRGDRVAFASTEHLSVECPHSLVGASFAARADAITRLRFDPELGPGALGYGDDTFFGYLVLAAGLRLGFIPDVAVTHHFDASRIQRRNMLEMGKRSGRAVAYISYHWEHSERKGTAWAEFRAMLRLFYWRFRRWPLWRCAVRGDYAPDWERQLVSDVWFWRQLRVERRRERNYVKRGLDKKHGIR